MTRCTWGAGWRGGGGPVVLGEEEVELAQVDGELALLQKYQLRLLESETIRVRECVCERERE